MGKGDIVMQTPQPASPATSKLPTAVIVIVALVIVCILACICVIVILALLGPSVGNVYSNIIENLPTATP